MVHCEQRLSLCLVSASLPVGPDPSGGHNDCGACVVVFLYAVRWRFTCSTHEFAINSCFWSSFVSVCDHRIL